MTRYRSGEQVKAGFYWNLKEWEAQVVKPEGGALPGGAEAEYVRLPLLAVLVLAPVMGAVYAFFLPFIGFAMVLAYLAGRIRRLFTTTPPAVEHRAGIVALKPGAKVKAAEEDRFKKAA